MRLQVKRLIARHKEEYENVDINIFRSAYNVHVDTLIEYDSQGIRHDFLSRYREKGREILTTSPQNKDETESF